MDILIFEPGVEGGFDVEDQNQYEYEEAHSVVILPDFVVIPLPCTDLPIKVLTEIMIQLKKRGYE